MIWQAENSLRKLSWSSNEKWDLKWASCCMKALPRQHAIRKRVIKKDSRLFQTI